MSNKEIIEKIIKGTFNNLKELYNKGNDDLRIIFPNYTSRVKKHRISEQELRFAFVEQLLHTPEAKTWHYSVETPTHYKYRSARNGNEPGIDGSRSGKTDLTLYDNENNPIAFFEFKAGRLSPNDDKKIFNREFKYDVIKLVSESQYYNDCLGYSLHLIEKDDDKIKNFDKYIEAVYTDYSQKLKLLSVDKPKEMVKYMPCKLNEL